MQYKCEICHDTGNKEKDIGGNLTCIACEAPAERIALEAFIEDLPAMGERDKAWLIHQRALAMAPKQEAPTQEPVAWLVYAEDHNGMVPQHPAYATHLHATRCASMFGQTPTEVHPLYDHTAPVAANGALTDERAAFEADTLDLYPSAKFNRFPSGTYTDSSIETQWGAWQRRSKFAAAGPDAALIEDAKRYRYLRNSASDDMPTWPINGSCWVVQYHHPQGTIPELKSAGFSSELDRAIDAAIAISGAKGN